MKPQTTKFSYTPVLDGEIRATTVTIDKYFTGEVIDVKDALDNKQPIINDGDLTIAKTFNLQTVLDDKQQEIGEFTRLTLNGITSAFITTGTVKCDYIDTTFDGSIGQNLTVGGVITAPNQPSFRAFPSVDTTNGTATLPFDTIDFDNRGGYDTTNYEYTVPVAGMWLFTWSCGVVEARNYLSSIRKNNIIYDRSIIDATQCLRTFDTISAKGQTMIPCVGGDIIKITVNGNLQSASLAGTLADHLDPDTQFNSFAGVLIG